MSAVHGSEPDPPGLHVIHQPGAAPCVVVVHGAMDRSVSFGRMVRRLPDHEVVRYDRRGYARSRPMGAGPLAAHVADLIGVLAQRPAVVVGHSVGGVIALTAAAESSLVRGVVAYEAPSPWAPWWPRSADREPTGDAAEEAEAFMRRMVGDRMWKRLPAATRAERRAEGEALRADLAMVATADAPYDLSAITVPVLAVAGSETSWWHRRAAEELAAAAPAGELVVLGGAGHGAHLTHPSALAQIVGSFVRRVT